MKIVKDGLYMYNDGEAFFIVKASGKFDDWESTFYGTVVYSQWEKYSTSHSDWWSIDKFKRLDNKITATFIGEE